MRMNSAKRASWLFLLSVLTAGCSNQSSDKGGADLSAGNVADMSVVPDLAPPAADLSLILLTPRSPTDHPALQQIKNFGGRVIQNMEMWTIVWTGQEDVAAQANQFVDWMLKSDYWTQSLAEYGVQAGSAKGVIVIPGAAPKNLDDSQVQTLLSTHVADALFPSPNANTVYSFIIPNGTTSTLFGTMGCRDYGGYHSETSAGNMKVPYAVNLSCSTSFDALTGVVSHESAEVATDPFPFSGPGFVDRDITSAGEIADLCEGLNRTYTVEGNPDAGTATEHYIVTRVYSKMNAAAENADPCVPSPPGHTYFSVALDPSNVVVTADSSGGGTTTVKIGPFSESDVGLIKWEIDSPSRSIIFSPNFGTSKAGDTIQVQVTVTPDVTQTSYSFTVYSESQMGGQNYWWSTLNLQ